MTADITRLFTDRDTRYHALVCQQGRLPIDSEENFASDIAEWERDDAFVETIAPSGSPDDGFRISLPVAGPPADFSIGVGSYYLGGARIENPAALTYRAQRDRNWLGFPMDAEDANEAVGGARRFLVWLDAFDQTVTATEDAELKDPGLGGPDGAAARRFGWRVRVTPVAGPGCVPARQQWLAAMGWTGKVDPNTGALRSNAPLTVSFNPADVDQDLCAPALTPGFLGARNECYRVMATRPGRYVWGRDDAAPLYRVRLEAVNGQLRRIVFLTHPRDEYVRPRQGHTVELLRWDERLPNGQKTAEPLGRFFTVATGYTDRAITLTSAVETGLATWLAGLPAGVLSSEDAPDAQRYFYLRLWTGGGAGGQPDHPQASGDLTGTGLHLSFDPATQAADYWVIAARPNAPAQMLPWALKNGMTPHGPRRHVAPLAFVDLDAGTVTDCRRRFRALYKLGGCCTVTVGDNENSWGDVSSIAEALARLPTSGGEICLGPGTWRENVDINDRRNIIFTGCGARTRWLAEDPARPLASLFNTDTITFRRITMQSGDAPCLVAHGGKAEGGDGNRNLKIEDCALTTPSGGVVRIEVARNAVLDRCRVVSGPMADPIAANAAFPAITLLGRDLTVRCCVVDSPRGDTAQQRALGGIHIRGTSRDIAIVDNLISGGAGNGITLGSVQMMTIPRDAYTANPNAALEEALKTGTGIFLFPGFTLTIDDAGCIHVDDKDPDPTDNPDGTVDVPVSAGAVYRLHIARNRITGCGANGIATYPLLPVNQQGMPAFDGIVVEQILIENNEIADNILREPAGIPVVQRLLSGPAGISLAFAIDVAMRDNEIIGNGAEPGRAASGIFIGHGEALRIERNRIERNGGMSAALGASVGGIVIRSATGGTPVDDSFTNQVDDRPALLVQGNVVHSAAGRALKVIARGPLIITGNRLVGGNISSLFSNPLQAIILFLLGTRSASDVFSNTDDPEVVSLLLFDAAIDVFGGDAVSLVNLGLLEELLLIYRVSRTPTSAAGSAPNATIGNFAAAGRLINRALFRGGETLFCDNQVVLSRGPGDPPAHLSSIMILTLDDLGFSDNQCEIDPGIPLALTDALLLATSLRVTANRFQDPTLCFLSLICLGIVMNTTSLNQATFGITASCANPAKLVDMNNVTLI